MTGSTESIFIAQALSPSLGLVCVSSPSLSASVHGPESSSLARVRVVSRFMIMSAGVYVTVVQIYLRFFSYCPAVPLHALWSKNRMSMGDSYAHTGESVESISASFRFAVKFFLPVIVRFHRLQSQGNLSWWELKSRIPSFNRASRDSIASLELKRSLTSRSTIYRWCYYQSSIGNSASRV